MHIVWYAANCIFKGYLRVWNKWSCGLARFWNAQFLCIFSAWKDISFFITMRLPATHHLCKEKLNLPLTQHKWVVTLHHVFVYILLHAATAYRYSKPCWKLPSVSLAVNVGYFGLLYKMVAFAGNETKIYVIWK